MYQPGFIKPVFRYLLFLSSFVHQSLNIYLLSMVRYIKVRLQYLGLQILRQLIDLDQFLLFSQMDARCQPVIQFQNSLHQLEKMANVISNHVGPLKIESEEGDYLRIDKFLQIREESQRYVVKRNIMEKTDKKLRKHMENCGCLRYEKNQEYKKRWQKCKELSELIINTFYQIQEEEKKQKKFHLSMNKKLLGNFINLDEIQKKIIQIQSNEQLSLFEANNNILAQANHFKNDLLALIISRESLRIMKDKIGKEIQQFFQEVFKVEGAEQIKQSILDELCK